MFKCCFIAHIRISRNLLSYRHSSASFKVNTVLLMPDFVLMFVSWPCNVVRDNATSNSNVHNNNNNNNNNQIYSRCVQSWTLEHFCYTQAWRLAYDYTKRITFRLAVLTCTYRCHHHHHIFFIIHRSAPEYLSRQLQQVSEVCTRRRLRSSSSTHCPSRTVRATIGGIAFSAAATAVWNSLPEAVCSSASLALFRKSLKTELFARSCSD